MPSYRVVHNVFFYFHVHSNSTGRLIFVLVGLISSQNYCLSPIRASTRCGVRAVITRSATFSTEIQNTSAARNYKQCHVSAEVNCFIIVQRRLAQPAGTVHYIYKNGLENDCAYDFLIPRHRDFNTCCASDFSINRVVASVPLILVERKHGISCSPPVETSLFTFKVMFASFLAL